MKSDTLIWICGRSPATAAERNIETLGVGYLQGVLGNMRKNDSVAFGQTGTGHSPNYQVISESGEKLAFRGQNHARYQLTEEFAEAHISREFSQTQILQSFCQARDRR